MGDASDFKGYEKSFHHAVEKIEDNIKLVQDALLDSPPVKFLSDGDVSMEAPRHSHYILNEIHHALSDHNMEEAANQLRREVDFCNAIPKMVGTPYEKSGQAGLKSLNKHKSADDIDKAMTEAWDKAWAESPVPFYDTKH